MKAYWQKIKDWLCRHDEHLYYDIVKTKQVETNYLIYYEVSCRCKNCGKDFEIIQYNQTFTA